ncbi:MAG: DUF4440 domain-containing protein [Candidatus Dactylopiibacterium carminicum]|nr:MAG: DUF4440 domain-containing protein [Candidatus Dactylopiibacterium carminicum]
MNKPIFPTPEDAEQAFYDAFGRSDLEALMAVWSEDDETVCVHPGGSRFTGLAAIRESWKQLFATGMKFRIQLSHPVKTHSMLMAVHCVLQHITVEGDDNIAPPLITTNVFVRGAHGWQLLTHHTSPAPDTNGLLLQDTPHVVH